MVEATSLQGGSFSKFRVEVIQRLLLLRRSRAIGWEGVVESSGFDGGALSKLGVEVVEGFLLLRGSGSIGGKGVVEATGGEIVVISGFNGSIYTWWVSLACLSYKAQNATHHQWAVRSQRTPQRRGR